VRATLGENRTEELRPFAYSSEECFFWMATGRERGWPATMEGRGAQRLTWRTERVRGRRASLRPFLLPASGYRIMKTNGAGGGFFWVIFVLFLCGAWWRGTRQAECRYPPPIPGKPVERARVW